MLYCPLCWSPSAMLGSSGQSRKTSTTRNTVAVCPLCSHDVVYVAHMMLHISHLVKALGKCVIWWMLAPVCASCVISVFRFVAFRNFSLKNTNHIQSTRMIHWHTRLFFFPVFNQQKVIVKQFAVSLEGSFFRWRLHRCHSTVVNLIQVSNPLISIT